MSVEKAGAIVIGAGVVGCAVAYELAAAGRAPIVLERGPRIAEGTTSRNSGVIHAGLYYKPGSLKAQACVRGNALLYEWCAARGVEHRKTGKWVVAGKDDLGSLTELFENAVASGARSLKLVKAPAIPGVRAAAALYSPETGIVDPAALSFSLQAAAEEKDAVFLTSAEVTAIERTAGGYRVDSSRGALEAETIINAAGLYADEVARLAGVAKYRIYPCRGDYFRLAAPAKRWDKLVYPVKKKGAPGLGVHLTLGLDGSYRLGPDAYYLDSRSAFADLEGDALERKREAFFEKASQYLEGISREQLSYDTCGIRPKLRGPSDSEEVDFVLSEDMPGLINLIGIESPGLTAALDLGQRVAQLLR